MTGRDSAASGRRRTNGRGDSATTATVAGLAGVLTAAVAGVWLGGWLAFETAYWRGFKSLVESTPADAGLPVGAVLLLVAVGLVVAR